MYGSSGRESLSGNKAELLRQHEAQLHSHNSDPSATSKKKVSFEEYFCVELRIQKSVNSLEEHT